MIRRGEGGWVDEWWGRFVGPGGGGETPLAAGRRVLLAPHGGPPKSPTLPRSTTLAPTDADELFLG